MPANGLNSKRSWLAVSIGSQRLSWLEGTVERATWSVSTASAGTGQMQGSYQTPLGYHCLRACIGSGSDPYTAFISRRPVGIYPGICDQFPEREDWILGRILWLSGLEKGKNRLGSVDTMRRYIYVHGTADTDSLGQPVSHGCIRMHPEDIVTLYTHCFPGMLIYLHLGPTLTLSERYDILHQHQ